MDDFHQTYTLHTSVAYVLATDYFLGINAMSLCNNSPYLVNHDHNSICAMTDNDVTVYRAISLCIDVLPANFKEGITNIPNNN